MKTIRLGDYADIQISNIDKKSKESEQEVRLCNFLDVYKNWAITKKMIPEFMVATASNNQIAKFQLKKGQVAITKDSETRDDIGVATYIANNLDDVVLGYHCALISPDNVNIDGSYLNAVLHSPYAQKYFEFNASGSGQRYSLTADVIEDFPVPYFDIDTQKQIGLTLDIIDAKIALNNSIFSDLETLAKEIYDHWFVQFDFPDENGKPYKSSGGRMVWNEELNREIPEGWVVKPFKTISDFIMGQSPKSDSYNLNHDGLPLINGAVELTKDGIFIEKYTTAYTRTSDVNDWLFCIRATLGNINLSDGVYCLGRSVAAARTKDDTFHEYVYFNLLDMISYREKGLSGSIIIGFTKNDILEYPIIVPPKRIIKNFHESISDSFKQKTICRSENRQLTPLRDFLLPMLMNGQIKIDP